MGTSKSFRMSDRIENMYNSIKKYEENTRARNDTEIFSTGIEMQFESATHSNHPYYRKNIVDYIGVGKSADLFNRICDVLEPLSFSDGYFLEDEMILFMTVVAADRFFQGYEIERINYNQYAKALEVVLRDKYAEDDIYALADKMEKYYQEKN